MNMGILEGLLFVSGEDGLSLDEISRLINISSTKTKKLLDEYQKELKSEKRGLKLVYLGNKYKLVTKEEHKSYYEELANEIVPSALSQAVLETLVIIAYKGPITVGMIDEIRGVSSRDNVRKLLYRGLIDIKGKSNLPGKPLLYETTDKFLDYFNLASLDELPKLEEPKEMSEEEKDLFISRYKEGN